MNKKKNKSFYLDILWAYKLNNYSADKQRHLVNALFYFKICTDYKTVLIQLVKIINYSCFTIEIIEKTYIDSHIKILSGINI